MKKLNILLADVVVLNQKIYNLHWNVRGEGFLEIHKMTEALYLELTTKVDEIAEKIAMNFELPISTLSEYLSVTNIKEIKAKEFTRSEVIEIVISDLTRLRKTAESVAETSSTGTLIDDLIQMIEMQIWLFKSSIKR